MYQKGAQKRRDIIEAASRLIYEKGYDQTSFTDIAEEADLNRGNFYHYFQSKDDILEAVIEHRLAGIKAMLAGWEVEFKTPQERLKRFVQILKNSENDIVQFGCPMGTLHSELGKCKKEEQEISRQMFDAFRDWLKVQFKELGVGREAGAYAMRLLAYLQGIGAMSYAYADPAILRRETRELDRWIDTVVAGQKSA